MEKEGKDAQRVHELALIAAQANSEQSSSRGSVHNDEDNDDDAENVGQNSPTRRSKFHYPTAVKLVPPFDDKNIEHFLISFKKTMAIHDFRKISGRLCFQLNYREKLDKFLRNCL